jgi:hypothetical protein
MLQQATSSRCCRASARPAGREQGRDCPKSWQVIVAGQLPDVGSLPMKRSMSEAHQLFDEFVQHGVTR